MGDAVGAHGTEEPLYKQQFFALRYDRARHGHKRRENGAERAVEMKSRYAQRRRRVVEGEDVDRALQ